MNEERFDILVSRIDAANAEDPRRDVCGGEEGPKELVYGRRMSHWVDRLRPDAPEALRIAARAQHIRRWEVPRSGYPMDRAGYLKWRRGLYAFHGATVGAMMEELGYDAETVERVKFILLKRKLKTDPDAQTLEDAAGLVFLENHFQDFAQRDDIDEEKMIEILRKTWAKMSEQGRDAALNLVLPEEAHSLIEKALT